jgi:hypothetical protein
MIASDAISDARKRQQPSEIVSALTLLTPTLYLDTSTVSGREFSRFLTSSRSGLSIVTVTTAPPDDGTVTVTAARFTRDRRHAGADHDHGGPIGSVRALPAKRAALPPPFENISEN